MTEDTATIDGITINWPTAGAVGTVILLLIGVLTYLIRRQAQFALTGWYSQAQVDEVRNSKNEEIARLDNRVKSLEAITMATQTALATSEAGRSEERTNTRNAIQSNSMFDLLARQMFPNTGSKVDSVLQDADTRSGVTET